ncbi:MAG: hypothetical protein COA84_02845 [Robiginitomaculum sp.]|nr:MAG: hypothetical protein COA84_02845 [Robiginitomaculum sp.]
MKVEKPIVQFDRDKFLEAVHYVCSIFDPDKLGNVKLHKVLYFSDMFHFLDTGAPITGDDYIKQKFGPTARHLAWAVRQLEKDRVLSVETQDYHGYSKKKYLPMKKFKSEKLSSSELHMLKDAAKFLDDFSARQASDISHNEAWRTAKMGEVIPYHTVYRLLPVELDESDMDWAKQEAKIHALA